MYWYGCGLPERPVQKWASSIQTVVEIHLCLLDLVTLRKKSTPWDNTTTLSSSAMAFMELWLVEPLDPSIQPPNNVYTIRNLSSGKYLTSHNGTSVILDNPTSNFTSEGWIITPEPSGYNQSVYSFKIRTMHYWYRIIFMTVIASQRCSLQVRLTRWLCHGFSWKIIILRTENIGFQNNQ